MNLWKHYKVQFLLMILAVLQIFAYFYPGYAKGISFQFLQALLVILIICILFVSRNQYLNQKLH